MGTINYLAKFIPKMSTITAPLRNLLKQDVPCIWSTSQQQAVETLKSVITTAPVLAFYDPSKELILENDACEYGLGSVLIQDGRPIAYASRCLSDAETRYANIEREMCAVVFGLEK